jgi:hypothetical protein
VFFHFLSFKASPVPWRRKSLAGEQVATVQRVKTIKKRRGKLQAVASRLHLAASWTIVEICRSSENRPKAQDSRPKTPIFSFMVSLLGSWVIPLKLEDLWLVTNY